MEKVILLIMVLVILVALGLFCRETLAPGYDEPVRSYEIESRSLEQEHEDYWDGGDVVLDEDAAEFTLRLMDQQRRLAEKGFDAIVAVAQSGDEAQASAAVGAAVAQASAATGQNIMIVVVLVLVVLGAVFFAMGSNS